MTTDSNFYGNFFDNDTAQMMNYTPGPVNKSSSLTSNECTRSSFDGPTFNITNVTTEGVAFQPIKLVLKRQSGNKYEVKNHHQLDENNNQMSK